VEEWHGRVHPAGSKFSELGPRTNSEVPEIQEPIARASLGDTRVQDRTGHHSQVVQLGVSCVLGQHKERWRCDSQAECLPLL
jgi:hypothetical protein